jgi:hypothetical protein
MVLKDIISKLQGFDSEATLFIMPNEPIHPEMRAAIVQIPDDDTLPPEVAGLRVFLDVWHVREVLDGKTRLAGLSALPSVDQQIQFLREYAEKGC